MLVSFGNHGYQKIKNSRRTMLLQTLRILLYMFCFLDLQSACAGNPLPIQQSQDQPDPVLTPEIVAASNKAKEAQRTAKVASRKALQSAENARSATNQALARASGYYVVTNEQGYHYEGGWRNKLPNNIGYNGFGILTWPNANRYDGEFRNGHKHGSGVFIGANNDRYEGAFQEGDIEGYGIYTYGNGNRYEGEFRHNNRQGYGVIFYPDGQRYEGEWRDNEKQGHGVMYKANGKIDYAGIWK
jgi:hypothetical protein